MTTKIEYYNVSDNTKNEIISQTSPKISGVIYVGDDLAANSNGGETIYLTGMNFSSGAVVYIDGNPVGVTTVISDTSISFVAPPKQPGTYNIMVVNSNGQYGEYYLGIDFSYSPIFNVSGNILNSYELTYGEVTPSFSGSNVTFTLTSGSLPSGYTLNSTTGKISGTSVAHSSDTQYYFSITVTDAENQASTREFSITILTDVINWISPTLNKTFTHQINTPFSLTISNTSGSGYSISYTVTGLPDGLSYSGGVISGTPSTLGTSNVTISGEIATTNRTSDNVITINIIPGPGQSQYTSSGTYSWTAPDGVTSVCVLCVGGGGSGATGGSPSSTRCASGGGGGALVWVNDVPVTPGQNYAVQVGVGGSGSTVSTQRNGVAGGDSYFVDNTYIKAGGGAGGLPDSTSLISGGTYVVSNQLTNYGGGNGGSSQVTSLTSYTSSGGGGAGGYSGNGGNGGYSVAGSAGSGGGGGGGGGNNTTTNRAGAGGGGVGIFGQGASGYGGNINGGGGGGSGGTTAANTVTNAGSTGAGGPYGGGSGGVPKNTNPTGEWAAAGASGAVRIIWGLNRSFPSSNTGNM